MKPVNFFAATDMVVVGYNPEMADYDNPRGELYGYVSYCYAESASGDRTCISVASGRREADCLPHAERMAEALNARLASGKLPVNFESWESARPAYGSDAYVKYGAADDLEWERSLEEFSQA